jgi:DUF1365 family protein
MMYLDLEELGDIFMGRWLWSAERFNVASFNRAYHLGDSSVPLAQEVRSLVLDKTGRKMEGPVRMLTQLRYFGYNFNPVSFYYCFDNEGQRVETIIVEIHNTPWGELYCYVLGEDRNEGTGKEKKFLLSKEFHISPFMDMDVSYEWEFTEPSDSVHVLMTSYKKDKRIFDAELAMDRQEITSLALSRMLMKYPFMNMKIIGAIYWQAFRLKVKGAKFYIHPSKRNNSKEPQLP